MHSGNYTILSVYSHKGGVGKTTAVDVIRGAVLSSDPFGPRLKYRKALLLDIDTQMNLTCKLLQSEENFQEYFESLEDINDFKRNVSNADIKTKLARLLNYNTRNNINPNPIVIQQESGVRGRRVDLIPGYPELQQLSKQMALELDQPGAPLNVCKAFQNLIQEYVNAFGYDLVVLDLGPDLYTINSCALWTSDFVLIPCTADIYSAMSFRLIANTIFPKDGDPTHAYNRFGSKLRVLGFLPNRVKVREDLPTIAQQNGIAKLEAKFAHHLLPYFHGLMQFENEVGTHPCYIPLIGRDLVDNEACSLLELTVHDAEARQRLKKQLWKLIRWLNEVL